MRTPELDELPEIVVVAEPQVAPNVGPESGQLDRKAYAEGSYSQVRSW